MMKPLFFYVQNLSPRFLYVLPLCFVSFLGYSQTPQEPYEVDTLLEELYISAPGTMSSHQKAAIPSMILYDRTGGYAGLKEFNNSNHNNSSGSHLSQALFEMRKASKHQKFFEVDRYKEQFLQKTDYSTSYLGILNTAFQSLNYTMHPSGKAALLYKNNKLQSKNAKLPLFNSHEAVVISPFREYFTGSSITIKLDKTLLFSEHPTRVLESVVLHTENGKTHPILEKGTFVADAVRLDFSQTGYKTLSFEVKFSDGSQVHTQAKIHVKIPESCEDTLNDERIQDFTWTSDISYQGYDETTPIFGELEYRIYFQTQDTAEPLLLKKPIIIIDGFDPLDGRKIEDCDPRDRLTDERHISIRDLMKYYVGNDEIDIIDELRDLGYDVVVVNHPVYWREINGTNTKIDGGADYIERNGLNHVSLYQEINRQLTANGSTEELVIVGPSMGGQISRYALAYMEKNDIDHNTRLWISVDSPHLGANIPLGLQAVLNQAKGDIERAGEFVRDWLGSTAAKQQLIAQMDGSKTVNYSKLNGKTQSQGFQTDSGHSFFKKYYDNTFGNGLADSKGYPQQTRNIALVNGSLSGSKSYYNPITSKMDSFLGNSVIGANVRSFQRLCILWWCIKIHIGSFEAHSMPAYNSSGKISRFKRLFKDNSINAQNINSRGNMDNIPGGYFDGFNEVLHGQHGSDPVAWPRGTFSSFENFLDSFFPLISDLLGGAYSEVRDNEYVHSFIPTVSALGHFAPEFNWAQGMDYGDLTCLEEIPFDSYYGENVNTQHTSFNEKSMKWLLEELDGIETHPHYPSNSGYNIEGPDLVCSNTSATFKIADNVCEVPSTVKEWSVSSGLTINSQDNLSINISYNDISLDSYETIVAELENGKSLSKDFSLDKPYIFPAWQYRMMAFDPQTYAQANCYGSDTIIEREIIGIGFNSNSTFEWEKISGTYNMSTNKNTITIIPTSFRERILSYKVRVKGSCNSWSDWRIFNEINPCYSPSPAPPPSPIPVPVPGEPYPDELRDGTLFSKPHYYFTIHPNPSSHYITVGLNQDLANVELFSEPIDYVLYGITNNPMVAGRLTDKNSIYVGDLSEGVYILKLLLRNYEEKHKVIISR